MANVNWASDFFGAVTSRLPDLLTEMGEGKELEALDKLRAELGVKDKEARAVRAKELQTELDQLNGKVPVTDPPAAPPEPPAAAPQLPAHSDEKPEATRRR